jgi:hypothetical protein
MDKITAEILDALTFSFPVIISIATIMAGKVKETMVAREPDM